MRLFSTAAAHFVFDQLLIDVPSKEDNGRVYLTWQPVESQAWLANSSAGQVTVTLRNAGRADGGKVAFGATREGAVDAEITLTVTPGGQSATFWVAGAKASLEDGDAVIEAVTASGTVLATVPAMVRIRKNAEKLTIRERDRLLRAFAWLDSQDTGYFNNIWNQHNDAMFREAHRCPAFLPWHRAFLLDVERRLQFFDPSVSLPYWRSDQQSPKLFRADFLGASPAVSVTGPDESVFAVTIKETNPLFFWKASHARIYRAPQPGWDPATQGAPGVIGALAAMTLGSKYAAIRRPIEEGPHDEGHVSWLGDLDAIETAARDPLFYMHHCNIDRIWAEWQRVDPATRMDASLDDAYLPRSNDRAGYNAGDTMWPWNGVTSATDPNRPSTAPGDGLLPSSIAPPLPPPPPLERGPRVQEMIDYQGRFANAHLGFDYQDIPYFDPGP